MLRHFFPPTTELTLNDRRKKYFTNFSPLELVNKPTPRKYYRGTKGLSIDMENISKAFFIRHHTRIHAYTHTRIQSPCLLPRMSNGTYKYPESILYSLLTASCVCDSYVYVTASCEVCNYLSPP